MIVVDLLPDHLALRARADLQGVVASEDVREPLARRLENLEERGWSASRADLAAAGSARVLPYA